jgi:hypothetical protein
MTIPCNKNITKQLNSYYVGIAITLQCLLPRTKRALNEIHKKKRNSKNLDEN